MTDHSFPEYPKDDPDESPTPLLPERNANRSGEPPLKYKPGQFFQEIIYAAWLVGWVLIAPGGFPRHWRLLTFERFVEGCGYALLLAPVAAALFLMFTAPIFTAVVQVICTILNILGYRPRPKKLDSEPLVTVIVCISFGGAIVCIILLTILKLSSPDVAGLPFQPSQAWERTITEIVASIMLVTAFCVARIFVNHRPDEEVDD